MREFSETWTRIASDGDFRLETVAVINGVEYSTITAPVITNGLLPDKTLSVGNCIAGTLSFTVMTNDTIPRSAEIVIKSRVTDDENTYSEWREFGHFWIDKRTVYEDLEDNLIEIEAFDAMLKGNQPYVDNSQTMNWPKDMATVVNRIAEQMGVTVDARTSLKTGNIVTKPNDDDTLLDILHWIGEVCGGNWTISPENKLRLVPLVSAPPETFYIVDENYRRIKTPEGDYLVSQQGESYPVPSGIGYMNVKVVLGDIETYEIGGSAEQDKSTDLGAYTHISGTYSGSAQAYFESIVGKGVNGTQTTSNYYSTSGNTARFRYGMPVELPADAVITRVYLEVNGHAESATNTNEYMTVQLFSGPTALSNRYNFKTSGTSNTTITLECTTLPTVEQLASAQLECLLGYYGGAINGATLYVEYTAAGLQIVSRITMAADNETVYTTGTDEGIEIKIQDNPYITQSMCDDLLVQLYGLKYSPYQMTKACFDPATELGDLLFAGALVHSVMYTATQRFDLTYTVDAAAPGEEELDSEYPFVTAVQKTQYSINAIRADNVQIHSEISQTQESIALEVTRATGAESGLSSRITVAEGNIDLKVSKDSVISSINLSEEGITIQADKVNLTGYATFTSLSTAGQTTINGSNIHGGTLTLGGNNNENGVLTIKNASDGTVGTWDKDGINIYAGSIDINGNFTVDSEGILEASSVNLSGCIRSEQSSNWIEINQARIRGGYDGRTNGTIYFGYSSSMSGNGILVEAEQLALKPSNMYVYAGGYYAKCVSDSVVHWIDSNGTSHNLSFVNGLCTSAN